jgi:hypothetical protein
MASYGADWQVRLGRYWCGLEGVGVVRQARHGNETTGRDRRGTDWQARLGMERTGSARIGRARQAR